MIQKLRFKFVLLSMSAMLLVLTVIIAGLNIVNYCGVVRQADALLEILSENRGAFPRMQGDGKGGRLPPNMSPEVPYETRYFTVLLNANGDVVQLDTSRIASVDRESAISLAKSLPQGKSSGFVGAIRYAVKAEGDGTRVTFLDCGRNLDSFRSFLLASVGISLLGYGIVFLLIAFFSSRIVRPVSESYEKQKRFITDAGHEIKTPLTIIGADADVLAMELGDNEWLEDIRKQSRRLADLTNDLIFLSRMEEAADTMPMIEFPFSDVVSETASSFQALAQTRNQEFLCEIPPMLSLAGNEKAIGQLVSILLDNAVKYTPEGGTIRLTVRRQNKAVLLSVANTTQSAIPKESLLLLFDRFYRMDPARSSQAGGYGIGLSMAKAIVSAHGGKIQAAAEEDGPTLRITAQLPVLSERT